ncbi:endonuclease/exonuclease/phosphatase family protein [Aquisalimonas sp.]|uniref:endonuclease/exonuclease/phosphatase family protein n=1 Tax=Aquisalimonas sp. TaxID=1872621 RepID=UPI0025B9E824|nr:endonuclease/exonuclease/phosphatase family protein [Aquisalimonas sp.]
MGDNTAVTKRARALVVGILLAALVAIAIGPAASQGPPEDGEHERTVTVMTRNLYLGASLSPLFEAETPNELLKAVDEVWRQVLATNFPERAGALADEIADHRPDLVGLQEVTLWRSGPITTTEQYVEEVEFDFLDILLDALADRGLAYDPVASVNLLDEQLDNPLTGRALRMTDRGVVLARADVRTADLKLANPQSGTFTTSLELPLVDETISVPRGWTSVDAKVRGKQFRFLNTHLEAFEPEVRFPQATELLAGPADTDLPVVLVGDVNSPGPPGHTPGKTYELLTDAGFVDAWTLDQPGADGFTCCHDPDLMNDEPTLGLRIDVALFRGPFDVAGTAIVGADPAERTASGLWPSDHAGAITTLFIPPDRPSGRAAPGR